ncbi:FkbM family methyltransferase [Candidatus Neomarinimicrobiota bacterium]
MKVFIKKLLRALFPSSHQKIIHRLQVLLSIVEFNPHEVQLAYRVLRKRAEYKVMIDVGAHIGGSLRAFALDDWRIFAFEPDPVNREELEQMCRQFPAVTIDTRAVSDEIKSDVPFYRSDVSSGISGLSSFHPSHEETGKVSTVTLDQFCQEQQLDGIDFLKVDTEGYDLFVLRSIPWERITPRLIVCEFEDRKTVPLGYNYHDMGQYLIDHGYHVLVSEWFPIAEYGGHHRWRTFADYPTELVGGELGHGNLIATANEEDFKRLKEICRSYQFKAKLRVSR